MLGHDNKSILVCREFKECFLGKAVLEIACHTILIVRITAGCCAGFHFLSKITLSLPCSGLVEEVMSRSSNSLSDKLAQ